MIIVRPITITSINWETYLNSAWDVLKRDLLRNVNAHRLPPDDIGAFLVSLSKSTDKTPIEILRESGPESLRHVFIGFILIAEEEVIYGVLENSDLSFTIFESLDKVKIAVVTGNLLQWKSSLISGAVENKSSEVRLVFDQFLLWFEQAGLSHLWANYRKVTLKDKTFRLEHKQL